MKSKEMYPRSDLFAGTISRRTLLKSAALLPAARSVPILATNYRPPGPVLAYVGTYTPNGQGIYLFSMDPMTGMLTQIKVAAAVPSPSWLALDPAGTYLYAVNEISNFNGTISVRGDSWIKYAPSISRACIICPNRSWKRTSR